MQVEWQKRIISCGAGKKQVLLDAVLVGCASAADGAEVEEGILLGTMDERYLSVREPDLQSFQFGLFWKNVCQKLDHLALNPELRKELETRIEEKVCKPPDNWALWPRKCSLSCRLKSTSP